MIAIACGAVPARRADASGDFRGTTLCVEAADVADDAEDLGGVREVEWYRGGHRCGAEDAFCDRATHQLIAPFGLTWRLIQGSAIDLVRPTLSCNDQSSVKIAE
jgi:hypothetical protein